MPRVVVPSSLFFVAVDVVDVVVCCYCCLFVVLCSCSL